MEKSQLLCCYFPTTILQLDDDPVFLKNLKLKLKDEYFLLSCQTPKEAKEKLATAPNFRKYQKELIDHCIKKENEENLNVWDFNELIHKKIYDPHRFEVISIALVDYSMPIMNGIEFCRGIQNEFCQKIMVTGEADLKTAVMGFNEGVIDKFIIKEMDTMMNEIRRAIPEKQYDFFAEFTETVISHTLDNQRSFFLDEKFSELFKTLYYANAGVEYYLLDGSGSYLFLDKQGRPYWFLVKSKEEIEEFTKIAKEIGAEKSVIKALSTKEKIPFFLTEGDKRANVSQWQRYLHPCHKLQGEHHEYYYALLRDESFGINFDEVLSYRDFLNKANIKKQ